MDKNGVVTFGDWQKGQVKHPLYGFGLLQNVEVFENPGLAKIKNRFTRDTTINPNQLALRQLVDTFGNVYEILGETGAGGFYKNGSLIQALNNAWDMEIYKNYIWVRHSTVVSAYGPLNSGGAQWFANIGTGFDGNYNGKILVGQDDFLYTGNGNFVSKIEYLTGGTVGIAPTITLTLNALDLPDGQFVTTLCEFGKNIMIGTQGGPSYSERGNYPNARIYPWNRQAGTLGNPGLADLPIIFSENGVNAMLQHANKLYVQAGSQGNVYVTDSTNYEQIAFLPYQKSGIVGNSTVYANAICVSSAGTLLIGLSTFGDGFSKAGVYEIDIRQAKYPISYRTISTLSQGLTTPLKIGFISQRNFQVLNTGWSDGAMFGVDTSDFRLYANFGAIIETEMVKVGSYNNKHTFAHVEWSVAEPLIAGQAVRISYRKNNKDAYTPLGRGTYSFTDLGGVLSFEDTGAIADAEFVQLMIELDQDIASPYGSNIYLIGVRLW